jgi:hypothetical protein
MHLDIAQTSSARQNFIFNVGDKVALPSDAVKGLAGNLRNILRNTRSSVDGGKLA